MSSLLTSFARTAASVFPLALLAASACGESDSPIGQTGGLGAVAGNTTSNGGGGSTGGIGGFWDGGGGEDAGWDAPWPDGDGLDPDEQWIADDSLWDPVPNTAVFKPCQVLQPAAKLPIAPLSWSSCGAGCELTDPIRLGKAAFMPSASTFRDGSGTSRPFLAFYDGKVANGWNYEARRCVDLRIGETVGAVGTNYPLGGKYTPCSFGRHEEAPRASHVVGNSMRIEFSFDPDGGATWIPGPIPIPEVPFVGGMAFDIDHPKPRFMAGGGTIYTLDYSVAEWTVLAQSEPAEHGAGEAELGVWVSPLISGAQRLRGWTDDGKGVFTLADSIPTNTCRVALSADYILGLAADTEDCLEPTTVKLWRAPRANPSSDIAVSPPLNMPFTEPGGGWPLRSWGNYAGLGVAVFGAGGFKYNLYVIELSTWKMWRIDARPGFIWHLAFTFDEQYLYSAEQPVDALQQFNSKDVATGIVRIPLASLDGSALATPMP